MQGMVSYFTSPITPVRVGGSIAKHKSNKIAAEVINNLP